MIWTPESAVRELPSRIRQCFLDDAAYLLDDLRHNTLKVVLADAPDPRHPCHKIRVVDNSNPDWYRALYHSRKHFRRDRSLASLLRIKDEEDIAYSYRQGMRSHYDTIYRRLITHRLITGYLTNDGPMPPTRLVQLFFGTPDRQRIFK